jgi:hypothetical protein
MYSGLPRRAVEADARAYTFIVYRASGYQRWGRWRHLLDSQYIIWSSSSYMLWLIEMRVEICSRTKSGTG